MSIQSESMCIDFNLFRSIVHFFLVHFIILNDIVVFGASFVNSSSSHPAVLYYDANSSMATVAPIQHNETVHNEPNPYRPVVYFQPTNLISSSRNSSESPTTKSNLTVIDFRKEKLDMNSSVEYEDNSSRDQSNSNDSAPVSDRTSKEEEVLWLMNKPNMNQQVQWSPIIPSSVEQGKSVQLKKNKRKKSKPIMLIAESVNEENDAQQQEENPLSQMKTPQMTKYLVVASDGSKVPVIMQSSTNLDGNSEEGAAAGLVSPSSNEDSTGKGDRLFDYYSDKLTTGPFSTDTDGNNRPVVNSFVKYSVPPPTPPLPGMPIMANVYWRKIIYPASMVPMSDQNSASASSTSEATLNEAGKVAKPKGQKYIVYYVKKDNGNNNGGQGMRLVSSSNDQQQQLAQSIIKQIEQMESNKVASLPLAEQGVQVITSNRSPMSDQDMGNSQVRFNVLNKQVIELPIRKAPRNKHTRHNKPKHQNIYPLIKDEVIMLRPKPPRRTTDRGNKLKSSNNRRKVIIQSMPPPNNSLRFIFRDSDLPMHRAQLPRPKHSFVKLIKI